MDAPATPLPFRITTDGKDGTVEVDGRDLTSSVAGLTFEAGYGEPARLHLALTSGRPGVIEGVAVVQVAAELPDIIRAVDPNEVRAAMATMPVDLSSDPVATYVEAIARVLEGGA